jgi:protein gp37
VNKQGNKSNPSGGIEWTHIFGPGTGYTANPVRGCRHQCRWRMPDGNVAVCYAKAQKERMWGVGSFEHVTFHPAVLASIRLHEQPAGIFIDSMSDLFAQAVTEAQIVKVLDAMWDCPQHIFFSLTKNPARLPQLQTRLACYPQNKWPGNLFLGVSMPPTFMFGKELTPAQQRAWFRKALKCLCACDATVRWVSLEPLSWDCSDILAEYRDKLHWAVIGAASNGSHTFQPDWNTYRRVSAALSGIPVFFKGNLRPSFEGTGIWRAEFPVTAQTRTLKCNYTGTPPFADASWKDDPTMCQWCAGTGHPYGDERYGICECPALQGGFR